MKYRTFLKTGEKISLLGFGLMRLPLLEGKPGRIDEEAAIPLIRYAIDSGVNYLDTAYMYHDGYSEVVIGKALKDGYREKVFLADKLPIWMVNAPEDMERIFDDQLKRLDVDSIDMYLIHGVNKSYWKLVQDFNTIEFLEKKRSEGRIRHIGFSFHDEFDLFEEVLKAHPWDFCQIQLPYMDSDSQAGVKGLKLAGSMGVPVVIMSPLKGGKLTDKVPESVKALWDTAPVKRTPAEWGLRWVADFPEVLAILSGMSTKAQVAENIKTLSETNPGSLTKEEHDLIQSVAAEYRRLIRYSCTACQYCMPCPANINIPDVISQCNDWLVYGGSDQIRQEFLDWLDPYSVPSACTECRACEEHCPQQLPVSRIMKEAAEIFEAK